MARLRRRLTPDFRDEHPVNLDQVGKREEVEAIRGQDLLQPRVVGGCSGVEAVWAVQIVACPWSALEIRATRPGSAAIASLAGAGEVLVSQTVKDLVSGSGLAFEDRGVHELKGVPGEWRIYAAV